MAVSRRTATRLARGAGADTRHRWIVCAVPMLAAGLTFLVTLQNGFAWDDANRIAAFAAGDTRPAAFLASGRGLAYSFHLLDYRLWGANAAGFHFTNLVLHSLATGLVALLALDLTRSARIGLLCGLLFAVHPVHVEAVASFCNRKDILALISSLLCLYMGRRRSPRAPVVALTCFALALYAKEVASVALPALLLAAEEFLPRGATPDGA